MTQLEVIIKNLIVAILNAKNEKGEYIMSITRCWICIYQVLVNHGILIDKGDFWGFKKWVIELIPDIMERLPIYPCDLKKISDKVKMFSFPIDQWRITPGGYTKEVKEKYCDAAELFEQMLSQAMETTFPNQQVVSTPPQPSKCLNQY